MRQLRTTIATQQAGDASVSGRRGSLGPGSWQPAHDPVGRRAPAFAPNSSFGAQRSWASPSLRGPRNLAVSPDTAARFRASTAGKAELSSLASGHLFSGRIQAPGPVGVHMMASSSRLRKNPPVAQHAPFRRSLRWGPSEVGLPGHCVDRETLLYRSSAAVPRLEIDENSRTSRASRGPGFVRNLLARRGP